MAQFLIALIAAGLLATMIAREFRRITRCPRCGGVLDADHTKYRYTVEWQCRSCGDTFEQLRQMR